MLKKQYFDSILTYVGKKNVSVIYQLKLKLGFDNTHESIEPFMKIDRLVVQNNLAIGI